MTHKSALLDIVCNKTKEHAHSIPLAADCRLPPNTMKKVNAKKHEQKNNLNDW